MLSTFFQLNMFFALNIFNSSTNLKLTIKQLFVTNLTLVKKITKKWKLHTKVSNSLIERSYLRYSYLSAWEKVFVFWGKIINWNINLHFYIYNYCQVHGGGGLQKLIATRPMIASPPRYRFSFILWSVFYLIFNKPSSVGELALDLCYTYGYYLFINFYFI